MPDRPALNVLSAREVLPVENWMEEKLETSTFLNLTEAEY